VIFFAFPNIKKIGGFHWTSKN